MRVLFIAIIAAFSCFAQPASVTWGAFVEDNFRDDTLMLRYKVGTKDTSAIVGLSSAHPYSPSLFSYKTYLWKVTPDSADSVAVTKVKFWIEEVDRNLATGDSVYSILADTSADSVSTTGVASDSSFAGHKTAFSANPASGYRVICSPLSGCSSVMWTTLKVWFRQVKKFGIFQ